MPTTVRFIYNSQDNTCGVKFIGHSSSAYNHDPMTGTRLCASISTLSQFMETLAEINECRYYNRYPVRFLRLTEEVTYDDKGNKLSVAVATWTSPAGVITPTTIRLLINNVKTDLSGNAIVFCDSSNR